MRTAQDIDVLSNWSDVTRARRPLRSATVMALVVAVLDQASKLWIDRLLDPGPCTPGGDECIDVFWTLRLHLHYNPGAAFSTGTSLGPLFGLIALVMAVVLLRLARKRSDRLGPILLGAIAGGAIGNLVDRVARAEDGLLSGAVVDFIDFQWWPIFNIADSAVVVGVIAFMVYSLLVPDAGSEAVGSSDHQGSRGEATTGSTADAEAPSSGCGG